MFVLASRWPTSTRQSSTRRVHRLDIAGVLGRPRELQQLRDDQPHALDLLVEQSELALDTQGLGAEQLAHQVEVALDHRDRVVDLVRDAGGELADRGQLLRAHELLLRLGQLARALLDLGVQFARVRVHRVEQAVEVAGELADLVM